MKIAVVGTGYVGMANAVLLAQHNEVIALDVIQEKVDLVNSGVSTVIDPEIQDYLNNKDLNLIATTDSKLAFNEAEYVIIATPTNYDPERNYFDTSSVETVIANVLSINSNAIMIIKSTIPVGFTEEVKKKFETDKVIFSPEFLREGMALHDNLYPSRIVVGEKNRSSSCFCRIITSRCN